MKGGVGRSFRLGGTEPASFVAPLHGGGILAFREVYALVSRPGDTRLTRHDGHYGIRSGEGLLTASLGVFPGRESYSAPMMGTLIMMLLPFTPSISAAPWGDLAVVTPNRGY